MVACTFLLGGRKNSEQLTVGQRLHSNHGFFLGRPPSLPFAREDFAFFLDVRLPSTRIAFEIRSFSFMRLQYPSR